MSSCKRLTRSQAVESITKVIEAISKDQFEAKVVPMVRRLCAGQWFTSKCAACALLPVVYGKCTAAEQKELLTSFVALSKDAAPMVRRSAVQSLGPLAKMSGKDNTEKVLLPVFNTLCRDDQDSVRLLSLEAAPILGSLFDSASNAKYLLPGIKLCATDRSWRVRFMIAEQICAIAKCFSQQVPPNARAVLPFPSSDGGGLLDAQVVTEELVPLFVRLLRDGEAEVRTAMAKTVADFVKIVQPLDVCIQQILPCIKELSSDQSEHVRCELASVVTGLAPSFGKEHTLNHLLGMFIALLKDDVPQVRLNVIGKLESINKVIGIELLSQSLLPAIVELAEVSVCVRAHACVCGWSMTFLACRIASGACAWPSSSTCPFWHRSWARSSSTTSCWRSA